MIIFLPAVVILFFCEMTPYPALYFSTIMDYQFLNASTLNVRTELSRDFFG